MKKNCILLDAERLANEIVGGPWAAPIILSNGVLKVIVWNDETSCFDIYKSFTPSEMAKKINMPRWEVVSIDVEGQEFYAIVFHTEDER